MKVKLKDKTEKHTGWLDYNKVYTVLGITVSPSSGQTQYLLWSDSQHSTALFLSSDFKVVSSKLSQYWEVTLDLNKNCQFYPSAWSTKNFWDDYNEGDEDADKAFHHWKKKIESEA